MKKLRQLQQVDFEAQVQTADDLRVLHMKHVLNKKLYVLLIFYPFDDFGQSIVKLCEIRDHSAQLLQKNVLVFGVNHEKPESHQAFIKRYHLPFGIIYDKDKQLRKQFGMEYIVFGRAKGALGAVLIKPNGAIAFKNRGSYDIDEVINMIHSNE
jgi:peroxiredoxin